MVKVKIYVEGGGETRAQQVPCRKAFAKLLAKAGFSRPLPNIIACGSREMTYRDFVNALRFVATDEYPMLLVDSEAILTTTDTWQHLQQRDGWARPPGAKTDQAQLMITCMETWIVADRVALRDFFGQELNQNALPPEQNLENRSKDDIQTALDNATRACGLKRRYRKGKRSFELLETLSPSTLREQLPHFRQWLEAINVHIRG